MEQTIIIKLHSIPKINSIRKKYDSKFKLIKNHITLAFPFKNVNQRKLIKHIQKSIKNIKPFRLTLNGIKKSKKEYYLFLMVKEGKNQMMKIHKELYLRFLTKWLRKDIPYVPHLTLGYFKTKEELNKALKDVKKRNLHFETLVNKISLITLNKNISIKFEKVFKLK